MARASFDGEVFIHRSFEVVVAGDVCAQRGSVCRNNIVRLDLRPPATVIELEGGVNVPIRTEGVNFASCIPAVAYDRVPKRLLCTGVGGAEKRESQEKSQGKSRAESKHGLVLCHR